jgi:hypothetical protein
MEILIRGDVALLLSTPEGGYVIPGLPKTEGSSTQGNYSF